MRTIRASEVSTFLFCKRAWWYNKRGEISENLDQMAAGTDLHYQHGRAAMGVSCLRAIAFALLLLSLVVLAIYFTNQLI